MNAIPPTRSPRVRPALRYLAIFSFAVLVPLAAHALWDHIELRRLVGEIQAIQSRGEPVTERAAGLTYQGATAEDRRASQRYLAAAMLAPEPTASSELLQIREYVHGVSPALSRPELARNISRVVDEGREALALADSASAMDFRGFTPGTEFSYRASSLWQLSRLISLRTIHLSLAGEGDQAAHSVITSLRARRALRDVRWFGVGEDDVTAVLSFSSPSPAVLERLQAALEIEEASYDPVRGLLEERARAIEMIWRRYYGADPTVSEYYSLPRRSLTETAFRPWITRQTVGTLRRWAETIAVARQPWSEKARDMEAAAARLRGQVLPHRPLAQRFMLIEPFYRGSVLAAADPSTFLRDRAARVAIAIERFRRDHAGALPDTLESLVPAYLSAVPEDPLSGAALLYKREVGAYTIYSVGLDGRDDDGDIASELHAAVERGWGRRLIRGRDIGVRVLVR